jgi:hypothetical protein
MADQERTPPETSAGRQQDETIVPEQGGDQSAESSAAHQEAAAPAAEGTGSNPPPSPTDPPPADELRKRLEHLTKKPEAAPNPKPEPAKAEEPADAEDDPHPLANPDKGHDDDDVDAVQKSLPPKAAKAFAAQRREVKALRGEVDRMKHHADFGRELQQMLVNAGAFNDLLSLEDSDLVESIRERAAIKRGEKKPAQAATTIAPEALAKLEAALVKAKADLEFDEVEAAISALRQKAPEPQAPEPKAAPQPKAQGIDPGELHFARLRKEIVQAGVGETEVASYADGRLMPKVLDELRVIYPGRDPLAVYRQLPRIEQAALLREQHLAEQARIRSEKEAKAKKPTDPQARPRQPLTNGEHGRRPAPNGGESIPKTVQARLAHLTGRPV